MHVPSSVVLIGTSVLAFGISTAVIGAKLSEKRDESCSVPPGVTDSSVAQHAMACRDLEGGRITLADYRKLIGLDQPAGPKLQWASSVRAVSTEYNPTSWSAQQVLGPPDAFTPGDNPKAWASREPDAPSEFIEVGFGRPVRLSGLEIYESFNPGATRTVELIGESGHRIVITPGTSVRELTFPCTDEAIVGARITLASSEVPGWNEIDAIGAVSCQ
jgi:hypothetical protein